MPLPMPLSSSSPMISQLWPWRQLYSVKHFPLLKHENLVLALLLETRSLKVFSVRFSLRLRTRVNLSKSAYSSNFQMASSMSSAPMPLRSTISLVQFIEDQIQKPVESIELQPRTTLQQKITSQMQNQPPLFDRAKGRTTHPSLLYCKVNLHCMESQGRIWLFERNHIVLLVELYWPQQLEDQQRGKPSQNKHYIMSQRKSNTKKRDASGTPTKIAQHSHAQPTRSPLTAAKSSSNQRQTVSYGELQTVLENIQEIRKKANQQIEQLTVENETLREQLIRSQHDYEELHSRLTKSGYSKHEFESKIIEQLETTEVEKKALQQELKERERAEAALEARISELQRIIQAERERSAGLERKIDQSAARWKWAFQILAGSAERSEELIWKVKGECSEGVWAVFESNSQLKRRQQLASNTMDILESELNELRGSVRQTTSLLQKSLDELSNTNAKLFQAEQQINQLRKRIMELETEGERKSGEFKSKLATAEQTMKTLQQKIVQAAIDREIGSRDLVKRVAELQEKLQAREADLQQRIRNEQYAALISSICDESMDYSVLLERVRYLQRFKTEHYLNVEKLQFLCKQLDS